MMVSRKAAKPVTTGVGRNSTSSADSADPAKPQSIQTPQCLCALQLCGLCGPYKGGVSPRRVRRRRPPYTVNIWSNDVRKRKLIPIDGRAIKKFRDGWVLYIRPKLSGDGWVNLKLVDTVSERRPNYKRAYYLGWNGERFARNLDLPELIKRMPTHFAAIHQKLTKMTNNGQFHRYGVWCRDSYSRFPHRASTKNHTGGMGGRISTTRSD